ncbi:hypothetical protein AVEN_33983-1 [Araneus ventricosus]|uniref:Uncharacterized protein n=1 Tax=Araneus ventricosus TaxID=182803 RepID=A0A4Y2WBF3_ARAVE|nr:hypothetical protein AVEN_33983-1 [Araneus ventricosus]
MDFRRKVLTEMGKCFIEKCLGEPPIEDCENPDFKDNTLVELLYVPVMFIASFVITVYYLLRSRDRKPTSEGHISHLSFADR